MRTNSSILLIGSGRLARHLAHWNSKLSQPNTLLTWNKSQDPRQLQKFLSQAELVWLAITDSALEDFCKQNLHLTGVPVVHFSGALSVPGLLCAHPLMSFSDNLFPDAVYEKIHFVISGCSHLQDALPGFKNTFSVLGDGDKSFYHALCVLAGNFPQLLWAQVAREMEKLGLPPEALDLYINQITSNYLQLKENSVTGPLIRKDYVTIEKNISSLNRNEKLQNIYSSFSREFAL